MSYFYRVALLVFVLFGHLSHAQVFVPKNMEEFKCSDEADALCQPCFDTVGISFITKVFDIGGIFPSWRPVLGADSVSVLEGRIFNPMISNNDLSIYHYTHDFCYNIKPDDPYKYYLSKGLYPREKGKQGFDTIKREWAHCEWESGIGQGNAGNPIAEINRAGNSAGFMTAGHKRYEEIWQWPTEGDWVHVEGVWIWDRGHPPAETEIHPCRMVAVRRNLPAKINTANGVRFATRIDVYANGDGGAFYNNRKNVDEYVNRVHMACKDYDFTVKQLLPRPSANAHLKCYVMDRPGHSFPVPITYTFDEGNTPTVSVHIPWKSSSVSDTEIVAQTYYLYWDEGNGVPDSYKIHTYKVTLDKVEFNRFTEMLARADIRLFIDVGGRYYFLNEFTKVKDILRRGMGKTWKHRWYFGIDFDIYVADDSSFRICSDGWEADGVDLTFGHIFNMYQPCSPEAKKQLNDIFFNFYPMLTGGCLDDPTGQVKARYKPSELGEKRKLELSSEGISEDYCPFSTYNLNDIYRLFLTAKRVE